jgi:hypothetical protein
MRRGIGCIGLGGRMFRMGPVLMKSAVIYNDIDI